MKYEESTAKTLYDKEAGDVRKKYEDRAEAIAKLTIPYLFPEEDSEDEDILDTAVQSLGARAVNNLSGKLLMTIVPPNRSFFRFTPSDEEEQQEITGGSKKAGTQLENLFGKQERKIMKQVETEGVRTIAWEMVRNDMVVGNYLIIRNRKEKKWMEFTLREFVIVRDAMDTIIHVITMEKIGKIKAKQFKIEMEDSEEDVEVFSHYFLNEEGTHYEFYQEAKDEVIAGTEMNFKVGDEPFMHIRWTRRKGENYGRPFCEQFVGDLNSYNTHSKLLNEGAVIGSKIVPLVNPAGLTDKDDLLEAENGEPIDGREEDIGSYKTNKNYDLQITEKRLAELKQELSFSFLMQSGAVRDAERVTREEIKMMAQELEGALGGIYSILSREFQSKIVYEYMKEQKMEFGDAVQPIVTTGISALGRNLELEATNIFLNQAGLLAGIVGAEAIASKINVDSIMNTMANGVGLNPNDVILSDETAGANNTEKTKQALEVAKAEEAIKQPTTPTP